MNIVPNEIQVYVVSSPSPLLILSFNKYIRPLNVEMVLLSCSLWFHFAWLLSVAHGTSCYPIFQHPSLIFGITAVFSKLKCPPCFEYEDEWFHWLREIYHSKSYENFYLVWIFFLNIVNVIFRRKCFYEILYNSHK